MDLGCLLLAAGLLAGEAASGPRALPFTDGGWTLTEGARVSSEGGRPALAIETTGLALRRDVSLQDGTIDLDVQVTRRRSFVYLHFRMRDEGEHEEVYLRPHKSGLGDALQYAPVWQGNSAWQLHHGPGGTAPVEFPLDAPVHVRLVLSGRKAVLFVGDMAKPALLVPRLARDPEPGFIGLAGFLPAGVTGSGPIARFSNVSVRPGFLAYDFAGVPADAPVDEPGSVRAWAVSRSFLPPGGDAPPQMPAAALAGPEPWARVEADPSGLVELHRVVKMPAGEKRRSAAVLRVHVKAETDGLRAFELGFSDTALVFLDGRPLFRGEASYSYDAPRREGLIGYDQARLYLPLRAGDNELAVLVGDSFGGWGIMGRFLEPRGLTVEAR